MAEINLPKLRVSKEEARQKIQAQIEKGQQLLCRQIRSDDELDKVGIEANNWSKYNTDLLIMLFDTPVPGDEYTNFNYSRLTYDDADNIFIENPHVSDIHEYRMHEYQATMEDSISSLKGIRDRLELYDEPSETPQCSFDNEEASDILQHASGTKVFIIHGRDDGARSDVALFVRDLGLNEIILDRQPNDGLIAILDKFEREAKNADFAIVLLTPDDVGALRDEADDRLKPRSRQNVIFELGYFMGKLGRKKVCLLIKGELENPSDLNGILYVPMDNSNGWQLKLGVEMQQAELPVDLNKLA